MLVLAGLPDDYSHEGRALVEEIDAWALPYAVSADREGFTDVARWYKKINAPVGALGLASLNISTRALASGDVDNDSTYRGGFRPGSDAG
jgi:hypothetical protein